MNNLLIGNKTVTNTSPTYFIADIAANHDGDLDRAKYLIKLAKEAGADAAKFQHFKAEKIVSDKGFKELGQKLDHQASWGKSVFEVYADASVPDEWTKELYEACVESDIEFMSTPYDFAAVELLNKYVSAFKIGSGDITWIEAIEYIGKKGKPIIIATGASEINEVERAVKAIENTGVPYCLMQCNTNHTGDSSNINFSNLNVLSDFRKRFPKAILGLSDHTHGHVATLGAIALGARVIEKHFTDDITRVGPDHKFSMTPSTWNEMVVATRNLEKALGDGTKRVEENESQTVIVQRRSVRAARPLKAGQTIAREDLDLLRPCPKEAIEASDLSLVVGRVLVSDKDFDEHISFEDLK
jgi:N-acetylneuraminate synthase